MCGYFEGRGEPWKVLARKGIRKSELVTASKIVTVIWHRHTHRSTQIQQIAQLGSAHLKEMHQWKIMADWLCIDASVFRYSRSEDGAIQGWIVAIGWKLFSHLCMQRKQKIELGMGSVSPKNHICLH